MSVTETCTKCVLGLSYILLWAASGVLLFVGSKAVMLADSYQKVSTDSQLKVMGLTIIVTGLLLCAVGLIGFFACLKRSRLLLVIMYLLMIVILFCEIGAVLLAVFHWSTIGRLFDKVLKAEVDTYDTDEASRVDMDHIQSTLHCCGIEHYSDWNTTTFFRKSSTYPLSCYGENPELTKRIQLEKAKMELATLFHRGCSAVLRDSFQSNFTLIIAVVLVFFLLQIMGLHSTCIVTCYSSRTQPDTPFAGEYARL